MIRAFCFDMDGTLLDTEILWVEATQQLVRSYGEHLNDEEALAYVYGIAWPDILENLKNRFPQAPVDMETMFDQLFPFFQKLRDSRDIRIISSVNLLKTLAQDYPVAIVSGSITKDIEYGIEYMGVEEDIDFFLSGDHCNPGKPDPLCYRMAAEKFGLAPEECLVFEDSLAGLQSAKAAGMQVVLLARPDRPKQEARLADWVLDDLSKFSLEAYEAHRA